MNVFLVQLKCSKVYMNQTTVAISARNADYLPAIVILSISGVFTISIVIFYQIALYRYSKLSNSEKRFSYSAYDLVFPKKIKPEHI